MDHYKPKTRLRVGGKMDTKGANIAGIILASGACILAVCAGISLILWAM